MATQRPLGNDETYLKSYDNLSRGRKQEIDLERRAKLKQAKQEADAGDSAGRVASDAVAKLLMASPLNPRSQEDIGGVNAAAAVRARKRADALQEAQDAADYKDVKQRRLYRDDVPGKIADQEPMFKKGGNVKKYAKGGCVSSRADGIAQRGKTRGKMV